MSLGHAFLHNQAKRLMDDSFDGQCGLNGHLDGGNFTNSRAFHAQNMAMDAIYKGVG
jgi:hypothetical protein